MRLVVQEELGSGPLGSVHPYRKDSKDKRWVVKQIVTNDTNSFLTLVNEIVIGFSTNHPAVVPIRGYFIDIMGRSSNIYIKMARMKENLSDFIEFQKNGEYLPEEKIIKYLYSLVCGLEYLHNRRIVHRDIKPTNILFDEDGSIKLSDVRSAPFSADDGLVQPITSQAGTYFYLAPELLGNTNLVKRKDLYKADVWSLGAAIAELTLLKSELISPHVTFKEPIIQSIIQEIRMRYSQALADIIANMLTLDPGQRKPINEIRKILEERLGDVLKKQKKETTPNSSPSVNKDEERTTPGEKVPPVKKLVKNLKEFRMKLDDSPIGQDKEYDSEGDSSIGPFDDEPKWIEGKEKKDGIMKLDEMFEDDDKTNEQKEIIDKQMIQIILKDKREDDWKVKHNKWMRLEKISIGWITIIKELQEQLKKFKFSVNSKRMLQLEVYYDTWLWNMKEDSLKRMADILIDRIRAHGMESLSELSLGLRFCEEISEAVFTHLLVNICQKIKVQKHLNLAFGECMQLSDAGIQRLAINIAQNLMYLQQLTLSFGNSSMTDEGVKYLIDIILMNLNDLQQLRLDFYECKKISCEAIIYIITVIGMDPKSLKTLDLSFERSFNMTPEILERLSINIKHNLTKLQKVNIYMREPFSTQRIGRDLKKRFVATNISVIT